MFDRSMVTPIVLHTQIPFDGVFDVDAENQDVYRDVGQPLLENALEGKLATLFVFGQTGSGKTYTMRSIEKMAAEELFGRVDGDTVVSLSYFELAGRKASDLLTEQKSEIRLREEEDGCFRPHDCEEVVVNNAEDMLRVMAEAAARRATDATTVNATSSRSHSVCRITIMKQHKQLAGRLLLVDCAGTERSRDTLYFKGHTQKESAEINSSLFALKDCIRFRQLAVHRQKGLPQEGLPLKLPSVRATPLTKVLAESLISTSAQLAAIATVSPNATDAEHTLDTLRTVYTLSGRGETRIQEFRQVLD
jgi:kinesin family protein 2/24